MRNGVGKIGSVSRLISTVRARSSLQPATGRIVRSASWVGAMEPPRRLTKSRDYEMTQRRLQGQRSKKGTSDERQLPRPRLSRRRPGRRFHPIRGGAVVYRGGGLAPRRGGQDREPQDGRSPPPGASRQRPGRPLVLPHVQRPPEVAGERTQDAPPGPPRHGE